MSLSTMAFFITFFCGLVVGRLIEAADWRLSGRMDLAGTNRHKSGGRWYRITEEGDFRLYQ